MNVLYFSILEQQLTILLLDKYGFVWLNENVSPVNASR